MLFFVMSSTNVLRRHKFCLILIICNDAYKIILVYKTFYEVSSWFSLMQFFYIRFKCMILFFFDFVAHLYMSNVSCLYIYIVIELCVQH